MRTQDNGTISFPDFLRTVRIPEQHMPSEDEKARCVAAWEEGRQEGREDGAKVTPRLVPARAWQVNIPLTAPLWLRWYQPAAIERT